VYSEAEIATVLAFADAGWSYSTIARATGVSRSTIRHWIDEKTPVRGVNRGTGCLICAGRAEHLPTGPYAYLLGLYLGDGHISGHKKGVYKLRIFCCNRYPGLMDECELAFFDIGAKQVSRCNKIGCTEVYSYSRHWPCLFPQHGLGMKHTRQIKLENWQQDIVDRYPAPFIRGLIHSDGCRVLNWVNGTPYPRYHFCNESKDILALFGRACERMDIEWRPNNRKTLSVAKRDSVARLDAFVGRKR
jgi:hypothetical protein